MVTAWINVEKIALINYKMPLFPLCNQRYFHIPQKKHTHHCQNCLNFSSILEKIEIVVPHWIKLDSQRPEYINDALFFSFLHYNFHSYLFFLHLINANQIFETNFYLLVLLYFPSYAFWEFPVVSNFKKPNSMRDWTMKYRL